MKHTCDVAPHELIAFTEEDLPEGRMKQLEAHVPDCPTCQEYLAGTRETAQLLRETIPEPSQAGRHDLLVRLYQEADRTTDRPHRGWAQAASLTAVGGTFLLAALLLWSGLGQFVDAIPRPFQQASPEQATEWVTDAESSAEDFEDAPLPEAIGDDYLLDDNWVESGIRVLVFRSTDQGTASLEVSQYPTDDPEPPGYMEQVATVQDVPVNVDDPEDIREIRWTSDGMAHHVHLYSPEPESTDALATEDVERIVLTFLDDQARSHSR